jgi:hypothetical protein
LPRFVRPLSLAAFAATIVTCSDSPSSPTFEDCPGNLYPAAGGAALWTVICDQGVLCTLLDAGNTSFQP